jgi:hypothetical protein
LSTFSANIGVFGDPVQFRISVILGLFMDLRSRMFVSFETIRKVFFFSEFHALSDADGCMP